MNNLWIALSVGLAATSFALHQGAERRELGRATSQLKEALAGTELDIVRLRNAIAANQAENANAGAELARAEQLLAKVRRDTAIPQQPLPDIVADGVWPNEKPYFHLAKRHLATMGYRLFDAGNNLSPTAATLFGMTEAEKSAVEAAARDYAAAINRALNDHAVRLPTPPESDTDEHRQVTYLIKKLGEDAMPLQVDFHHSLEAALGTERADLLFAKAESWLYRKTGDGSSSYDLSEYRVKLEASRSADGTASHMLWLGRVDSGPSFFSGMGVSYPPEGWSELATYIGLFGDRPLLEDRPPLVAPVSKP
ncbi:MAG TPA: hypothetical protein VMF06_24965 [Candidatus Limnocylindria bacterium]|jgi:hypothetical protein|nr:hypothetical protein [Candidatus Limnocylindria bacterium]